MLPPEPDPLAAELLANAFDVFASRTRPLR